jgi:hypothetical protein
VEGSYEKDLQLRFLDRGENEIKLMLKEVVDDT